MAIFNSYVSLSEGTVYNARVIYQPDNGDLMENHYNWWFSGGLPPDNFMVFNGILMECDGIIIHLMGHTLW